MSVTSRIAGRGGTSQACCAMKLFEAIVLNRAAECAPRNAPLIGQRHVKREQHDRRTIDGHRRRHFIQGNFLEQRVHVRQSVDRDAAHPHFAQRAWRIRIITH